MKSTTQKNSATPQVDAPAGRWSSSLLVLAALDVSVFVAAGWLALQVPEALDRAAASANVAWPTVQSEGVEHANVD